MKEQYDSCLFDNELKKLDSDLVWTNANNPELKSKLIRDMNKVQLKTKFTMTIGKIFRWSAVATVLRILLIIGYQERILNHSSGSGSSLYTRMGDQVDSAPTDGDKVTHITVKEQNLVEGLNGNGYQFITNEASIPRDLNKKVTCISGKPKMEATKINELILVKATYPVTNGPSIVVSANINMYGSAQNAKEAFELMYPKSKKISISNRDAILYHSGNKESSELLIFEDNYLYIIKGENDKSTLLKVAEQINFSN